MNYFKRATKEKTPFQTIRGSVNVIDLWEFNIEELTEVAKSYIKWKKECQCDDELIDEIGLALGGKNAEYEEITFKLETIKEILVDKVKERDQKRTAEENRREAQKIEEILYVKQNQELADSSVEELQKRLKSLTS